jgi:hypothetical protein
MFRDPSKERLSKAQIQFLDENVPAFMAWAGQIGLKIQPWQRRIVEALIRKDVITPDGKITESGQKAWARAIERMGRRRNRFA